MDTNYFSGIKTYPLTCIVVLSCLSMIYHIIRIKEGVIITLSLVSGIINSQFYYHLALSTPCALVTIQFVFFGLCTGYWCSDST